MAKTRRCRCCGALIEHWNLWVCDDCQQAGLGAEIKPTGTTQQELLRIARDRERYTKNPLRGMTVDEIALLARAFLPPYSTYGGLRGYVAGNGRVPPKALERKREEG